MEDRTKNEIFSPARGCGLLGEVSIPVPATGILREAASRALGEDRGPADITTLALVGAGRMARARIFSKENAVLAGGPVAERVFQEVDPALKVTVETRDGERVVPGQTVLRLEGKASSILTGERAALNFIQRLSGVASLTARYVEAAAGKAAILDTRKTTPGLRALEKYAVLCGGGMNHRFGLYDAFMVKDNHVALMEGEGGLREAVRRAREFDAKVKLIVEADTLGQVREWAGLEVDQILLDNMTTAQMREAVAIVAGRCRLEASGNMTLDRVPEVADSGVNYISVGALTHSAVAVDFSLEMMIEEPI